MYECFHCCSPHSVIWDSDFSFEDCGYEGEGIVHFCHCTECGAEIEYRVPCDSGEDEDGDPDELAGDEPEDDVLPGQMSFEDLELS